MSQVNIENKFKLLGFNDDECECHICGRIELKGTYAIEDLSTGVIFRAGSVCGSKMSGWTTKELVIKLNLLEKQNKDNAYNELKSSIEYINHDKKINELQIMLEKGANFNPLQRMEFLKETNNELKKIQDNIKDKYNLKFL